MGASLSCLLGMGEGITMVLIMLQSNLCLFFYVYHIHDARRKTGRTESNCFALILRLQTEIESYPFQISDLRNR